MASQKLVEMLKMAVGFAPVDLQTAANDGRWINLSEIGHLAILFIKGAGTAGDDPTLTLEQAKDNAGDGAKGLNFDTIHTLQGADLEALDVLTKVTQTAASTYTDLVSAEVQALWIVEIDAEDLDVNNDFDHVRARVADIGSNAQLGVCLYLGSQLRNAKSILPSSL